MNREIKFRAWNETDSENEMIYESHELRAGDILKRFDNVMQYTGLKDKTGKEIYDGDILSDFGRILYKVAWKNGGFRCSENRAKMGKKKSHLHSKMIVALQFEVIGNIYENPELL